MSKHDQITTAIDLAPQHCECIRAADLWGRVLYEHGLAGDTAVVADTRHVYVRADAEDAKAVRYVAESISDAMRQHRESLEDQASTYWAHVVAYRLAYYIDGDEMATVKLDEECVMLEIEPKVECLEDEHAWEQPHEIVGGDIEAPGIWGHGSGYITRHVCRHCGIYREMDTCAEDPETGMWGLLSVSYEPSDTASVVWALRMARETANLHPDTENKKKS